MTDMDLAISLTLGVEGDWSDHPQDPGGKTLYGITEATWRRAVRLGIVKDHGGLRKLNKDGARKIYEQMYWRVVRADDLPRGLNALVFDIQVNSGQGGRRLQRALNALANARLATDNAVGPATLAALNDYLLRHTENLYRLMAEVSARRFIHWTELINWQSFKLGWSRRGQTVLIHAVRMAEKSTDVSS